jgi:hypothetical protein
VGYSQERTKSFGEETRKRIAVLQDLDGIAIVKIPVLENSGNITVEGYHAPAPADEESYKNWVSPAYFAGSSALLVIKSAFSTTCSQSAQNSKSHQSLCCETP